MSRYSDRRILVTGATGFIGTRLCRQLQTAGARVEQVSRSLGADLSDPEVADAAVARTRPQSIFHLASQVTGSRDVNQVLPTLQSNLMSTVNILLAAQRHGVDRVVCVGSMQEPDPPASVPNSPYAAAKSAATAYCRLFSALYGLSVTVARVFMVYGPGQRDTTKVLPYVVSQLIRGQHADLSTCGHPFDWVHVQDVVDALLAIHETRELHGAVVDVGTGHLATVRDVLCRAADLLDSRALLRFGALPDRLGEPVCVADVEATFQQTGWRCKTDLSTGIADTVAWYQQAAR